MALSASGTTDLAPLSELRSWRLDTWDVLVPGLRESFEALEPIRVDRCPRLDVAADEVENGGSLEIGDDLHPGSSGAAATPLDANKYEGSLAALELATASQPSLRPTHPGIVDLDLPSQRLARPVDHGSTKLVQDHPGRLVAADRELTLQEQRRHPALVGRHQIGCPEPGRQLGLRVVKDGPCGHRSLVAAGGALPSMLRDQRVAPPVTTSRTGEPVWPPAGCKVLGARLLGREPALELAKISGE